MSDSDQFDMMASHVRTIADELVAEMFGPRCIDYVENCECCRRWKLLDDLLENPFKG